MSFTSIEDYSHAHVINRFHISGACDVAAPVLLARFTTFDHWLRTYALWGTSRHAAYGLAACRQSGMQACGRQSSGVQACGMQARAGCKNTAYECHVGCRRLASVQHANVPHRGVRHASARHASVSMRG